MVQLLDCSLRDGGYINNWQFGKYKCQYLIRKLSNANVDYLEVGFLNEVNYVEGSTNFMDINCAEKAIEELSTSTSLALMVRPDRYDSSKLCRATGKIRFLRIAFYKKDLQKAIRFALEAENKGYQVFLNMVNTTGYSNSQLREMASVLAEINPYAVTIVDTFGCMTQQKLTDFFDILNSVLPNNVKIAFHPHNNMLMAYPLAQCFIKLVEYSNRDGIIDGTLMGIGRNPGNLPSELIANFLNTQYGEKYNLGEMSAVIDRVIEPIKKKYEWGYSTAYMFGAAANINRNYVEYFLENNLPLDAIYEASKTVPEGDSELFNPEAANTVLKNAVERWKNTHCAFKLIYQYSAQQVFEGINVYDFRYSAGKMMATYIPADIIDVIDYVMPVPNTGKIYADGFSNAIGKNCNMKLIKKDCSVRTFCINDTQERERLIETQLMFENSSSDLCGKNVAVVDEAIFSGTTLKIVCNKLRQASVEKIFVIIPIGLWKNKCSYNGLPDHKMLSEEISSDRIANFLGADEVFVQSEENLKTLVGKYDCGICIKCFCDGSI